MKLGIQLRLHPKEQCRPCDKQFNFTNINPCYYKQIKYAYNGIAYTAIIYEIHYLVNRAVGLNGILPTSALLGFHAEDTERVVVLYDINTMVPLYVFFSAHAQEGRWYPYNQCDQEDNRLVVYAALNSHRNAIKATINWRMFGFSNDYTSNKGPHINMLMIEDDNIDYTVWNKEVLDTKLKAFIMPLYIGILDKMKSYEIKHENEMNNGVQ